MNHKTTLAFLVFLLLVACKNSEEKGAPAERIQPQMANSEGFVPESWIKGRVAKAKQRLEASEAGKVVWQAMEAHGGLANWYANGPFTFHFNYRPLDGGTPRDTYQAVDTWSSRARHFQAGDSTAQYGWDGTKAWVAVQDSTVFPYNTRFWSLTPYFFAAQPFVLDGKGVNLELLPQKEHLGKTQDVVKVTFDAGTGDAPDDYYVLYFDAMSHNLSVIRYIVSYPGYFKKGEHLPEKLMQLEGAQVVDGIWFPKQYSTHWLNEDESKGEHITSITLSEIAFQPGLGEAFFKIPDKATILEGL
ncbi:MAG: hypothetical protein AAF634_03025 [Bacteroidota bacterium]